MLQCRRTTRTRCRRSTGGALLAAVLAGCILSAVAQAQVRHLRRNEHYKEQVEQLEQAWRTAQLTADVGEMDKLLAEDYVGITMTGQVVTKMQQLDRTRSRDIVLTRIDLDDVKVKLIGTTAIVTSLAKVDGTNEGSNVHGTYRYTRVYTHLANGVWRITNFEATRVGPQPPGDRHDRAAQPPAPSIP